MIGQRAQTAPCREGFAWHSRGDYPVRTAAIRRCCKDTDFSYKTKHTRLIYTPLLRVKAAPDGGEGCTRRGVKATPDVSKKLHQMGRTFPPIFPPLPHLWRVFSAITPPKLGRFAEKSPTFFQKISIVFRKISNVFQNISNVFAPLAQRFSSFRCHSSK